MLLCQNAHSFRTQNGARIGDVFMRLIHARELCGANPFGYLYSLHWRTDRLPICNSPAGSASQPWRKGATNGTRLEPF